MLGGSKIQLTVDFTKERIEQKMSFKFKECESIPELLDTLEEYMTETNTQLAEELGVNQTEFGFSDVIVSDDAEELDDLTDEEYRTYHYEDGDLVIQRPIALRIRESGTHFIVMHNGTVACIPAGWRYFTWMPKEGEPHISF